METKKIEILVDEKTGKRDGKDVKFNVYTTFTKNGRKMSVKFRNDVKNLPTEHCMATINVDDMNVDNSGRFPVLWVKDVQGYESIEQVRKENNAKKINTYFD